MPSIIFFSCFCSLAAISSVIFILFAYKIESLIVLSHTISSKELSSYNVPIVTIAREDQYVNSTISNMNSSSQILETVIRKHNNATFSNNHCFVCDNFPDSWTSFFSCDFTLRSNFFMSSEGGSSSGFIPLEPSISRTD